MKGYRCSVCKKELTKKEYNNYMISRRGLEFEWGQCNGKTATIEEFEKQDAIVLSGEQDG